jgi:hypothetical protein
VCYRRMPVPHDRCRLLRDANTILLACYDGGRKYGGVAISLWWGDRF